MTLLSRSGTIFSRNCSTVMAPRSPSLRLRIEMVLFSFITLIYGEGITEEEANEALRLIKNKAGDGVDINLVNGGQPVYYFILSVE